MAALAAALAMPLAAQADQSGMRRLDVLRRLDALRGDDRGPQAPVSAADLDRVEPATRPLGAFVDRASGDTVFRLFTPRAAGVTLHLYASATGAASATHVMSRLADGTWEVRLPGALVGQFYDFTIDGPSGPGECFDETVHLSDPCARANVGSAGRSVVVEPSFEWGAARFQRPALADLVVYEMHVRDYTAHPSAGVPAARKGRYLGLLEGASSDRVLGNLVQLGVNAVELLPVHEYDNKAAPSGVNHWGYMTTHFFAPESYYASGEEGQAVAELKQLIRGLHERGIAVILDVVFNHTAEGNQYGPTLSFKGVDNKLYYRLTPDFFYWNGTGCGNEFASERPAVRRYIIDCLKYWVEEYRVDGFRFDLAASLDKATLLAMAAELPQDVYLIAEPWTADWNRRQWSKGDLKGTRWSNWNDDFKNTVRGFIKGGCERNNLITVIAGTCFWWTGKPTETVNFLECHDNDTIDDLLGGDQQRNKLGAVVLLTSQGVPMLHEGQEFGKNKGGNANSYDQDNAVNYIDWKRKDERRDLFDFYSGLTAIRAATPHFRKQSPLGDADVAWLKPADERALGYRLKSPGKRDVLVLLNGNPSASVRFELGAGQYDVLCDGERASTTPLRTATGDYGVPPLHGVILRAP